MTIILGSESFSPNISGVAVSTELLAEDLANKGHKVYMFAPSPKKKTYKDEKFKKYTVIRVRSYKNPFRKGFYVALMPYPVIKKIIKKINPDLIHIQDPAAISTALRKVAIKKKIPIIVTNHFTLDYIVSYLRWAKPIHPFIKKVMSVYLANFYNKCNVVFCPTETVKKDLKLWGVKVPIYAISNGVDLDRFFSYSSPSAIQIKYHLPLNDIVLYAGRIDKDKNIQTLIEAIPEVIKKRDAHFVFVGSGDELPKYKKLVSKLNIDRYVTFLGWIDHKSMDFPELYQVATIFAIPSAIETQSIVTLEAMASGLPIVAANAGALPELVKNDKNGYLFNPKDSNEMADKIIKILENKQLREKMSKNSLEMVTTHTVETSFKKIISLYEKNC